MMLPKISEMMGCEGTHKNLNFKISKMMGLMGHEGLDRCGSVMAYDVSQNFRNDGL